MFKSIKPSSVNLIFTVLAVILVIMKIKQGNLMAAGIAGLASMFFFSTHVRLKKQKQ
jgi:hypothetical protein